MGSNYIPSHVNHGFQKVIQVKLSTCIIFILIIQYNIETINYKNKNPQVNLMGSNPTPRTPSDHLIRNQDFDIFLACLINDESLNIALLLKINYT
jgi:hypothetical protein